MTSPNACKARGLSSGRVYTREGKLVASVTQEGLIRYHAKLRSQLSGLMTRRNEA